MKIRPLLEFAIVVTAAFGAAPKPSHPLDPLSGDEMAAAVAILKTAGKITETSRFGTLVLKEPPKSEVLSYAFGSHFRREAFVIIHERSDGSVYEAVIDLNRSKVISWKVVPGVQVQLLPDDFQIAIEVVRSDPQWQAAMRKRGIADFGQVQVDPWSAGYFGFPQEENRRIARALSYLRGNRDNPYARPIEGVVAYVDLNARKVLRVIDAGVRPVPRATADFDPESIGVLRTRPKPLNITQPEGPSFEIHGNEVHWQNWRFRYALNRREGLVLYTVGYWDRSKLRPILYRASVSEMVVPYGDPSPAWFFRNAFDTGEYGLGSYAFPLNPLHDCPPNATFLDAVLAGDRGAPVRMPRAIGIYERDGGLLWKYTGQSRRARDLVVTQITTAANYEYGFNWIFHQDGSLEMEVDLTGIMSPKAVDRVSDSGTMPPGHAHLVAPHIEAPHHQHFFCFRLDFDVDGPSRNRVVEMNTQSARKGPGNPYANAFTMRETPLRTEREGRRLMNLASSRKWKIVNLDATNFLGQNTGYILAPGENSLGYAGADSFVRKRAGFMNAHLWVTPYDETQLYAAGDYPYQSRGGDGLSKWTQANRPIDGRDLVLWYTLGVTHIPRPEEWPVMPVHRTGFRLLPASFFDANPALDVPPEQGLARGHATGVSRGIATEPSLR